MAFVPHKTFSGAAFPIREFTAGGTINEGDILNDNGSNGRVIVSDGTADGQYVVALADASSGDTVSCVICTPDVIFAAPAGGALNTLDSYNISFTPGNTAIGTTSTVDSKTPRATILGSFVDSAGTTQYECFIHNPWSNA